MPKQAPLRLVKRCRLYLKRGNQRSIPHLTRGLYVLYRERPKRAGKKVFEVAYIGVGGIAKNASSGIGARVRDHDKEKEGWTHYSFYEVHDNISREEILELEGLLLRIFRHDPRIKLSNVQLGSNTLRRLSKKDSPAWAKDFK